MPRKRFYPQQYAVRIAKCLFKGESIETIANKLNISTRGLTSYIKRATAMPPRELQYAIKHKVISLGKLGNLLTTESNKNEATCRNKAPAAARLKQGNMYSVYIRELVKEEVARALKGR